MAEERVGVGVDNQSDSNLLDSDIDDSSVEEEVENDLAQNVVRNRKRRHMTEEDLNISGLFHTNVCQNNKILHVAKMLHTMKDTISFVEENVDLAIDSRGNSLSNADKRRKGRNSI